MESLKTFHFWPDLIDFGDPVRSPADPEAPSFTSLKHAIQNKQGVA
jgi:hypothetical protein